MLTISHALNLLPCFVFVLFYFAVGCSISFCIRYHKISFFDIWYLVFFCSYLVFLTGLLSVSDGFTLTYLVILIHLLSVTILFLFWHLIQWTDLLVLRVLSTIQLIRCLLLIQFFFSVLILMSLSTHAKCVWYFLCGSVLGIKNDIFIDSFSKTLTG